MDDHLFQWVDYLPNQQQQHDHRNHDDDGCDEKDPLGKRLSLDPTDTNVTETNESMDMEDWPDSSSLEGYSMLPPAMLLDHDPIIQQELLLDSSVVGSSAEDPSVAPEMFANSLEELLEHRRNQLATYMQASMRTRQFLEPHIRQRAGLANILTQIERSSITIQEHLLHNNNNNAVPTTNSGCDNSTCCSSNNNDIIPTVSSSSGSDGGDNDTVGFVGVGASGSTDTHSVDMTGMDIDEDVEDFAASVLADDPDCLL